MPGCGKSTTSPPRTAGPVPEGGCGDRAVQAPGQDGAGHLRRQALPGDRGGEGQHPGHGGPPGPPGVLPGEEKAGPLPAGGGGRQAGGQPGEKAAHAGPPWRRRASSATCSSTRTGRRTCRGGCPRKNSSPPTTADYIRSCWAKLSMARPPWETWPGSSPRRSSPSSPASWPSAGRPRPPGRTRRSTSASYRTKGPSPTPRRLKRRRPRTCRHTYKLYVPENNRMGWGRERARNEERNGGDA